MSEVETPQDLLDALRAQPELLAAYQQMPPSHQREYVKYINEAKQLETRTRRIAKTVGMVAAKEGSPG